MNSGSMRPRGLFILVALSLMTLFVMTSGAAADSTGVGQPMAENLVEIKVADRAAIERLQADAESVGAEFNDHYLRAERGRRDAHRPGPRRRRRRSTPSARWATRSSARSRTRRRTGIASTERSAPSRRSSAPRRTAETGAAANVNQFGLRAGIAAQRSRARSRSTASTTSRTTPAGSCRSRRTTATSSSSVTTAGTGRTMVVTWDNGPGTAIGPAGRARWRRTSTRTRAGQLPLPPDPHPDRRARTRATPSRPDRVRVASSSGAFEEGSVTDWIRTGLPPHAAGFQSGFHNRYMDPTEIYERFDAARDGVPEHLAADLDRRTRRTATSARRWPPWIRPAHGSSSTARIRPPAPTRSRRRRTGPATPVAGIAGDYVGRPRRARACRARAAARSSASRPTRSRSSTAGTATTRTRRSTRSTPARVAVVIVNNVPGAPTAPGGTALPGTTIPTVQVGAGRRQPAQGEPARERDACSAPRRRATRAASSSIIARVGPRGRERRVGPVREPGHRRMRRSRVSVRGKDITVSLATGATGALTSTAAQIVAAINAHPDASALVKALTFQGNAGTGIVAGDAADRAVRLPRRVDGDPGERDPARQRHVQRGPVPAEGDADRQAPRRLEGRHLPVLPAARA